MGNPRYQVFISSTFDDLKCERQCLWQRLTDYGYIVAGMENFPATSEEPFEYIKPLIDESDYFLLVIGDRYGTEFGTSGKSYTEMEYEYAAECGVPILVFPIDQETAEKKRTSDRDERRANLLSAFRQRALTGRMAREWKTQEDLASAAIQGLAYEGQRRPRPGWIRGSSVSSHELSEEIVQLRMQVQHLQEKIHKQPTLTASEMAQALNKEYCVTVTDLENDEVEDVWINVSRIILLQSIFEDVTISSLHGSVAVAASTKAFGGRLANNSKQISVNLLDLDSILIFLRSLSIVSFDAQSEPDDIVRGPNWLIAQEVVKLTITFRESSAGREALA